MQKYNRDIKDAEKLFFHRNVQYVIKLLIASFGMQNSGYVASEVIRKEKAFVKENEKMPTPSETIGMLSLYFSNEQWDEFASYIGACLGCLIDTDEEDAGKVLCDLLIMASDDELYGMNYDEEDLDLGFILTYKLGGEKHGS